MKKVKVMLASIAILAVVAGAFAFKAKKAFAFNIKYTTTTTYVAKVCNLTATVTIPADAFPTSYYYTVDLVGSNNPCLSYKTFFTIPD